MEFLRTWILGVTAAALAVALAQALAPEGPVKRAGRLVCGLVLVLAMVRPVLSLDPQTLADNAARMGSGIQNESELPQADDALMKTLIAEKAGAYIVDKAGELGGTCRAEVEVRTGESGYPVPWSVTVRGSLTAVQRERLTGSIAEELAIPADRQRFEEGGTG